MVWPVDRDGSPPRTRGRGVGDRRPHLLRGITPAYAGKRQRSPGRDRGAADHPRVRGEEAGAEGPGVGEGGSPPRTRGRAQRAGRGVCGRRITPAYAGKSGQHLPGPAMPPDHPRVRGEEARLARLSASRIGSPPRTRGRARANHPRRPWHRITPAYAGKRPDKGQPSREKLDHPRVRGEERPRTSLSVSSGGSPPRTRGRVPVAGGRPPAPRITPAYAGKRYTPATMARP